MSVRVVARIRPLLRNEIDKDIIVEPARDSSNSQSTVKIPNPKCHSENFSFQFNNVYDRDATQTQIFDDEVGPTVKQLFKGYDVTIFAYGVTGTGKTHTMRGGKALQDRGVIPRLLSSIYRRARRIEKDGEGSSQVEVVMSYYEIYNDKVFDLFEPPEKRTAAGLPIREANGKTTVVGLTERPCTTLKEFETLYDVANVNRSTSATKLNAHSSRSHAILCVKVVQTTGEEVRVSTASAIDLAGSEDNRRTDNNKERLVESASINKSLFVLAQCVEAISKKQARIPYRESKMTRILSLGQNDGITIMILNLAPVRSYHLDTLSSLNFANRTKKIEVNEVENQPFFNNDQLAKGKTAALPSKSSEATSIYRQPLRPKVLSQHGHLREVSINVVKPTRQFSVYSDKGRPLDQRPYGSTTRSPKRTSSDALFPHSRPAKMARPNEPSKFARPVTSGLSKDMIEQLIEKKVSEALAERADQSTVSQGDPISDEVQKRLEALEKRVDGQESERAEGLQYLLMAKQHQVRGEHSSALKMYQMALPHFPNNEKLIRKVAKLRADVEAKKHSTESAAVEPGVQRRTSPPPPRRKRDLEDDSYHEAQEEAYAGEEEDEFIYRPRTKIRRPQKANPITSQQAVSIVNEDDSENELGFAIETQTPRTRHLLEIINSKDIASIKMLKGVGGKKAEMIVNCICSIDNDVEVKSLAQLGKLRGIGVKTVENMRNGLVV